MSGQASGSEILIHQHVDLVPGEVVLFAYPTREEILARRVVIPPDLERVLHIWGEIPHPIHLPFATIDAHSASGEINGIPGQRTYLRDTQATAQHEEELELCLA